MNVYLYIHTHTCIQCKYIGLYKPERLSSQMKMLLSPHDSTKGTQG